MSKKSFGGFSSVLGEIPEKKKIGRPVTQMKVITKSSQEGTKENETRATFIVREELLDKLKAIAYWERLLIKDVAIMAIQGLIAKYEEANGEVKPIPQR